MDFNHQTLSLISKFKELSQETLTFFSGEARAQIAALETLLDVQFRIAANFTGIWIAPQAVLFGGFRYQLMPLLLPLFFNNFFSFYSALELTIRGLYGPARPILRNIFESLMISKFCRICNEDSVLNKWNSGQTIYFSNSILKRIITPDPAPFFDFWAMICSHSHATKVSSQFFFEPEKIREGVLLNIILMSALLECNYHLLNSYLITPGLDHTVREAMTRSEPKIGDYEIPELRKKAHLEFNKNREFLGSDSIKLIVAYKRKWVIKN